jgi:hypothetical protein
MHGDPSTRRPADVFQSDTPRPGIIVWSVVKFRGEAGHMPLDFVLERWPRAKARQSLRVAIVHGSRSKKLSPFM